MVDLKFEHYAPMRDGVRLRAMIYTPDGPPEPRPSIVALSPYTTDQYHERGLYFAERGFAFVLANCRGRGGSEGAFRPLIQEADDGFDLIEWVAAQPFCDGNVAMWGGSYSGYNQWATAGRRPPHLTTIAPAAAAFPGVDFPFRRNISAQYLLQWLTFTSGPALQMNLFTDQAFWAGLWRKRFERGEAFQTLANELGGDNLILKQWLQHPSVDEYWDEHVPTDSEYASMNLPVLSITGTYDDDQPGALAHYRTFMQCAPAEARARHYLVIGPWDHAGTRTPKANVGGLSFGPESLVDLPLLHAEWYAWTMAGGAKPTFLKDKVAYYVAGREAWAYAPSLSAVTAEMKPLALASSANANRIFQSGRLVDDQVGSGEADWYDYDPRDVSTAELETSVDPENPVDQRMVFAQDSKQLVYHSDPFDQPTVVAGFFQLKAYIGIDAPDTDIRASIYEITIRGESILLTTDQIRARHRLDPRRETLVSSPEPLLYDFDQFLFTARQIAAGSRLRLVVGPVNSIFAQKNYNSGLPAYEESMADARTVRVVLHHDAERPSTLFVPLGADNGPA